MGDYFATLSGVRVSSGQLTIPKYGMWTGDLSLPGDDPVPDDGPFIIGNLSLQCHIYRQATFAGSIRCRVVAGAGGWREVIPSRQYVLESGVQMSLVLNDAAREVGETVNIPTDRTIGSGWVRKEGKASDTLRLLAGSDWYIDDEGVTQLAAWPTAAISSQFDVIDQDGATGMVTIATEDYASWMPGCTFEAPTLGGTFTNGGIMYTFDDEGIARMRVLTSP